MKFVVIAALFSLTASTLAYANDADVSFGGTPKLLSGQTNVRMLREKIVMNVGDKNTKVVCDFWFKNEGPACNLRMGFPDDGNENEESGDGHAPKSNFHYFKSWVDGKAAHTTFALGDGTVGWHTKTVKFGGHRTVHVRDEYELSTGSGIVQAGTQQGVCRWARYVVHTGASWKGSIGASTITVHFDKKLFPMPLKAVNTKVLGKENSGRDLIGPTFPPAGTIVYRGVSQATCRGSALIFIRKNWRPTEDDDLDLWFGFKESDTGTSKPY